jgi:hypothetical protein
MQRSSPQIEHNTPLPTLRRCSGTQSGDETLAGERSRRWRRQMAMAGETHARRQKEPGKKGDEWNESATEAFKHLSVVRVVRFWRGRFAGDIGVRPMAKRGTWSSLLRSGMTRGSRDAASVSAWAAASCGWRSGPTDQWR